MKSLRYQKIVIYSFCILLIAGGLLTLILDFKPISRAVMSAAKEEWTKTPNPENLVVGAKDGLESGITDNVFAKEKYIDWYGIVERVLGRRYIRDADPSSVIVKDNHNLLQFITFKADTTKKAEEIEQLKKQLDKQQIPLLFVQAPLKMIEGFTELPDSVADYSNSNTDGFLKVLNEKGIGYIDLREEVNKEGLDKSSLFYKTDHHWVTETAFWAVGKVVEKLKEDYKIMLDKDYFYTNLENYQLKTYEKSFLGSQGRRVGRYYAGVDDYTLITPAFDTKYSVIIHKSDISKESTGTFEEAILHKDLLDPAKSIYTNRYAAYFGADYPEVIIKNEMNESNKKILIIKDSFALPFSAFLSTMAKETRMLDLRYYKKDLQQYIEAFKPDIVLYVYKSVTTQ